MTSRPAHKLDRGRLELAKAAGVKVAQEFTSRRGHRRARYTPIVQAIKDDGATIALDQLNFASNISLRREAKLQGVRA